MQTQHVLVSKYVDGYIGGKKSHTAHTCTGDIFVYMYTHLVMQIPVTFCMNIQSPKASGGRAPAARIQLTCKSLGYDNRMSYLVFQLAFLLLFAILFRPVSCCSKCTLLGYLNMLLLFLEIETFTFKILFSQHWNLPRRLKFELKHQK